MNMSNQASVHVGSLDRIPLALRLSEQFGRLASTIGKWATLFMIPMIAITVWDVFQRKAMKFVGDIMLDQGWLDARNWMYGNLLEWLPFRSTLLQELEWHFHVANFALVLGYGYIYNRHVRVDLVREKLAFRKQAWIEFFGVSLFMIPFCLVVAYFSFEYVANSFITNEQSSSLVGLSHRWAIKSILVFGLLVAAFAGFAIWLQVAFALFGPRHYQFPCFVIENEEEKTARREMMENIDASFGDGSNENKRGNSTKLLSRQMDDAAMKHDEGTAGQAVFTGLSICIMVIILVLIFHTFDFWSWLL
jgi:TRAP-type mannitol/chloroaromatic compound transport system permease small subunit